jgi:hypothetical protein
LNSGISTSGLIQLEITRQLKFHHHISDMKEQLQMTSNSKVNRRNHSRQPFFGPNRQFFKPISSKAGSGFNSFYSEQSGLENGGQKELATPELLQSQERQVLQRQNDPGTTVDPPNEAVLSWDPINTMNAYVEEWSAEEEAVNEEDAWGPVELSDEGPTAWIGSGVVGRRKELLLKMELSRLHDDAYRNELINQFSQEEDPDEAYLTSIKSTFESVANDETSCLAFINKNLKLDPPATPENFIDNPFLLSANAANAFPNLAWEIVRKLIAPPDSLVTETNQHLDNSKRFYDGTWAELSTDMFAHGLPVSYPQSLNLTYYKLLRPTYIKKLYAIPDKLWMAETFVFPGEPSLYTPVFQQAIDSFTYYGVSSINAAILKRWQEPSYFKWLSYDTLAISKFRKTYPNGFYGINDFYNFEYAAMGYSLGEIAFAILTGFNIGGQDPYQVLGLKSIQARSEAPDNLSAFIRMATGRFEECATNADASINQLREDDKFEKAIDWSLKKGFAGTSINILLEKLDEIVFDIVKEWTKEKAIKKGVTTFVSIVGGPVGRLASWLYTAYDTYDDIEDITEIIQLANALLSVVQQARNSQSVIDSQRASARLAETTVSVIPLLLQLLGSKILDKLAQGVPLDKPGTYSDAKTNKLVEETAKQNDATKLSQEQVDAEVLTALKAPVFRSKSKDYNAIILLPNGHQWRRNHHGIWCRATDRCLLPGANSQFISDLNKKVDASVYNADVYDPDQAIAPGVKSRSSMAAEIGMVEGARFAVDELGLTPLNLPNPFTKSDFSDTGFDDIMADAAGNWYILEYKGGDSTMNPASGQNPAQMTSAWVRYVIGRIRQKGSQWDFIANEIEAKLNAKKLYGYGISTPINEAGIVMDTLVMTDYNRIQFQ